MGSLLTRKDVAQKLDLSLPTVDRLIARADFPKIRIGRSVKVPEELLNRWIEDNVGKAVDLQ